MRLCVSTELFSTVDSEFIVGPTERDIYDIEQRRWQERKRCDLFYLCGLRPLFVFEFIFFRATFFMWPFFSANGRTMREHTHKEYGSCWQYAKPNHSLWQKKCSVSLFCILIVKAKTKENENGFIIVIKAKKEMLLLHQILFYAVIKQLRQKKPRIEKWGEKWQECHHWFRNKNLRWKEWMKKRTHV